MFLPCRTKKTDSSDRSAPIIDWKGFGVKLVTRVRHTLMTARSELTAETNVYLSNISILKVCDKHRKAHR